MKFSSFYHAAGIWSIEEFVNIGCSGNLGRFENFGEKWLPAAPSPT
jgi:hypothetical protein